MGRWIFLCMVVAGMTTTGCNKTCEPGEIQICPCAGGGSAVQTCSGDGESWGACTGCPVKDAGFDLGNDAAQSCPALVFNGADKVVVKNAKSLDVGKDLTILAWVKITSLSSEAVLVSNAISGQFCGPYGLKVRTTGEIRFGVRGGGGGSKCGGQADASSKYKITTNKWVHLSITYDASEIKFYVNGTLDNTVKTTSIIPYTPITDLWIGKENGPHMGVVGLIGSIQLWSRTLNASEITTSMSHTVPNTDGLVGIWKMNEGAGTTTMDSSGNGNHGTLSVTVQ